MTNDEMDSIQIDNAPMLLERALTPGFKLLAQCLVESTDGAGTGSDPQQRLSHFSHFGCHLDCCVPYGVERSEVSCNLFLSPDGLNSPCTHLFFVQKRAS